MEKEQLEKKKLKEAEKEKAGKLWVRRDGSYQRSTRLDISRIRLNNNDYLSHRYLEKQKDRLVPSCFAIFTFEPLTLSLTSMPSCDLESLTNILILCLILKASDQSLRKSLSLNLELS
ncbi:hypothetical protein Tco_0425319 [Tanacetum coccineum]